MTEGIDGLHRIKQPEPKKGPLEKIATRVLLGKPDIAIVNSSEYQAAIPSLRELYEQVWRWHGTGRYHYHDGQVKDVLKEIIEKDGLVLHKDPPLDYTRGVMDSVSTSPSRTYSSLYAQLHFERGKRLRNPSQTKAGWLYYMSSIVLSAAINDRRLFSRKFREQHNLSDEGTAYFHKKYARTKIRGKDMLESGVSDIAGNYPLLVGIREGAFQEANIAKVLRTHESRSETSIPISSFTHIEVPAQNIEEVQDLLEQAGREQIPVIALEWGEEFCKSLPLSFVKDGVPIMSN